MTIQEFWRSTFTIPRAALVAATVAGFLNLGSYAGLTMSWAGGALGVVHLAITVLGFALVGRIGVHHALSWRGAGVRHGTTALPWRLIWSAVVAAGYLLVVCVGFVMVYGEGNAEVRDGREVWVNGSSVVRTLAPGSVATFDARMLRVFSAVWIFFGLLIAVTGDRIERRIRAYREVARQAGA